MNIRNLSKNNKGASLVLVIVAMLFVGLIASIVLTVTVGNRRSTKTTVESSENFYSAEGVLDDLKMFLKKLAISSAADAYGATLEKFGEVPASDLETVFANSFKTNLATALDKILKDDTKVDQVTHIFKDSFINDNITFDRVGVKTIKISSDPTKFIKTGTYIVLKDVEISLVDADGFESKITTDITFKATLPSTGINGSVGTFDVPVDHFIIISDGNINTPNATTSVVDNTAGIYTGNIYAKKNFYINTDSANSKSVTLKSQYVITGGDINVTGGQLNIQPIGDPSVIKKGSNPINAEVWCRNFKVGDGSVNTTTVNDPMAPSTATGHDKLLSTHLYTERNLELNGLHASFTANGGRIWGFSNEGKSSLSYVSKDESGKKVVLGQPKSSAIILNGLGARLDLSNLWDLKIAGTAYTALSDIDGVSNSYKNYDEKPKANIYYQSQGESITYRTLQPLYLIPGDYIPAIGHNPMTEDEFNSKFTGVEVPESISSKNFLNSTAYTKQVVRYVGKTSDSGEYIGAGKTYVYLFWNFKSSADAVSYFNLMTSGTNKRYDGLLNKQIEMLGSNVGCIDLPATNVACKGNAIEYAEKKNESGVVTGHEFTTISAGTVDIGSSESYYGRLLASADKNGTTTGYSLIETMFGKELFDESGNSNEKGLKYTCAKEAWEGKLRGPFDEVKSGDKIITYTAETGYKKQNYYLITGPNLTLNATDLPKKNEAVFGNSNDVTYVIISPGNVTITAERSTDATDDGLRGIIIAGGDVKLSKGLNMTCMGMITRTSSETGKEEITEFRGLLDAVWDDTEDNANTRLRSIFGIADSSAVAGSGSGDDFVKLEFSNWRRN